MSGLPTGFELMRHGRVFRFRPVAPDAREIFIRAFDELSPQSKYMRFFQSYARLSERQLDYLTAPDGHDHVAWGVLDAADGGERGVAVGRFIRAKEDPGAAEVAITVIDAYQRMGLARLVFCLMNLLAAREGIGRFRYHVLDSNRFVHAILSMLGPVAHRAESGVHIIESEVIGSAAQIPDVPGLAAFRRDMGEMERAVGGA